MFSGVVLECPDFVGAQCREGVCPGLVEVGGEQAAGGRYVLVDADSVAADAGAGCGRIGGEGDAGENPVGVLGGQE
jgi:hypothetical protein